MARDRQASVHLTLRGRLDEDAVMGLRQQLATCLASGVNDIRVRADEQQDLELPVLQVLQGAADHLARLGGSLIVTGVQPKALTRIRIHGLDRLLPEAEEPVADADVAEPRPTAPRATGSGHSALRRS